MLDIFQLDQLPKAILVETTQPDPACGQSVVLSSRLPQPGRKHGLPSCVTDTRDTSRRATHRGQYRTVGSSLQGATVTVTVTVTHTRGHGTRSGRGRRLQSPSTADGKA